MARKETITKQNLLDTAFEMTREEGFSNVTARKVAAKAGCSTQPIFRVYKNMDELWDAVYEKAEAFFDDFCTFYPRTCKTPFVNLGMAYIAFAGEEKHLFELLFLSDYPRKKGMFELLNGGIGNIAYEIALAGVMGCPKPEEIFKKIWLFIHGAACMSFSGDCDLSDIQTRKMLEKTYEVFAQEKAEQGD